MPEPTLTPTTSHSPSRTARAGWFARFTRLAPSPVAGVDRHAPSPIGGRLATGPVTGLLAALLIGCAAPGPGVPDGADRARAASLAPDARPEGGAPVFERLLPNGMKVLVRPDRRAPTVVHMVWYRAGSIDEVNGRTGVAHVLEHLMFKGTRRHPGGEFSRQVAALGGRENAFTSRDYTGYYQQVPSAALATVMALEADRMANLVLSKEDFDKEIKVVMEERRLRTEDKARALVHEHMMAAALTASPARAPVIGWMSDLEAMTVDDARDWYRSWYTPDNALLVVVGDVEPESVWRLAVDTYGRIPARGTPARKPQREPAQRGVRRVEVKAPAENPYVLMAFRVPKLLDLTSDREPYALDLLAAVLGADENSRFTRQVVRGARVANQAGAGYDSIQRGPALFMLDGTPAAGKTTADVERALRAEVARVAAEGVREDELRRIKSQYVAGRVYGRDSIMGQAMEIAGLEVVGFSHADVDRLLAQVRSVTADEVKAVAEKYFGDDALTVVTLAPQPIGERRTASPQAAGARH